MMRAWRRETRRGERGVALLMVVAAIAILTAVAVEFSYHSRVEARLATNARDELRAYYLARSAVQLSRLVLHFQREVDQVQIPNLSGILGGLGGSSAMGNVNVATGQTSASTTQVAAGTPKSSSLHLRLWDIIPVDSGTLQIFMGAPPPLSADLAAAAAMSDGGLNLPKMRSVPGFGPKAAGGTSSRLETPARPFGDFDGTFHSDVSDEESKINVNALNQLSTQAAATATEMLTLMHWKDQKYDFLFDDNADSDPQHHQVHREDLLSNIHDWIDSDTNTTGFNPLQMMLFSDPFVPGFGDEDAFYQRQDPRYHAKNAPLDTVDELYMVHGINDRFMKAFGSRLTVYSAPQALLNVNTNDTQQQLTNILVALDTNRFPEAPIQLMGNPLLLQTILTELQMLRSFAFIGISVSSFVAVLAANQLPVRPELTVANSPHAFLGDTSQTFTIEASGEVGDVQSRVTAVIRYDDNLGKLLYWKEE
jgi:general secretion pathway protein K